MQSIGNLWATFNAGCVIFAVSGCAVCMRVYACLCYLLALNGGTEKINSNSIDASA